jgi:hypothetical protein
VVDDEAGVRSTDAVGVVVGAGWVGTGAVGTGESAGTVGVVGVVVEGARTTTNAPMANKNNTKKAPVAASATLRRTPEGVGAGRRGAGAVALVVGVDGPARSTIVRSPTDVIGVVGSM